MKSRRGLRGAWIAIIAIAALLIVIGSFHLLPDAKAPVDLVIGGATLAVVGIVSLIRTRRRGT